MAQLFNVAEILSVTGGRLLQGSAANSVTGFAFDSRTVAPGDCFVAMRGERVDGHDFAQAAVASGADCVLVGHPVPITGSAAVVQVPDPLTALGLLGRTHRQRYPVPLVGITGSVGKTTTKELIAAVLARRFHVFRSPGNFNSEVGLPIGIMALGSGHTAAVQEMGMRALGEISYLVSIALPTVGVVTNVGPTHLELLGTVANIALAKSELVRGLPPSGAAVLNADDPLVAAMAAQGPATVWYYGFTAAGRGERWVSARDLRRITAPERPGDTARDGVGQRFTLVTSAGEAEVFLPAPGRHSVHNALAAVAVGLQLGMNLSEAAAGLADYAPSGSRMRILTAGGVRILDDTYNAAPASVVAALGVMRELAGTGRCIAALGSMFELGRAAEAGHHQVGAEAARLADAVLTVGDLAAKIAEAAGPQAVHFPDKATLCAALTGMLRPGDTVLVKGSRGMAMEAVVQALEQHLA